MIIMVSWFAQLDPIKGSIPAGSKLVVVDIREVLLPWHRQLP